ncbi:MAG: valine--tRNA ligase [Symbiobacteriaceae bacterium]|nr:valine--tRNA ligase [Symbiobacteriaceae bacterium]
MTPQGSATNMATAYDPKLVESKWYAYWMEQGFSQADSASGKKPFTIVIPPPNVTGQLHMGHALDNAIQDILIRWRRMSGDDALWVPGTDHAGIATQAKLEEEIAKEGLTRHDLGREGFLARVWDWKEQYGSRIVEQLRMMGASCDWSRERFTLDEGCSKAVRESFVRYYERGLIYRGTYIVNWCPHCMTVISDIEVDHEERAGRLYYIKYPLASGNGFITVATTRPETMLGDVAVAVHPTDERYRHLIGQEAILPLMERVIPIIADATVDPAFGTGCVKITPGHDPNDFEMGLRHNLPQIAVMAKDATMNENAGIYQGMERMACRARILQDLQEQGLMDKIEEHHHSVGTCSRCDAVIEPLVSEQWFVKMKPLAEPAIAAVREGRLRFVPERYGRTYLNWMENIRDWCISRQLWWGHRIPAWTCPEGHRTVAIEDPACCSTCGSTQLTQDPDVLDTWFSSALWPFSTLGWPETTPDLKRYFPTDVLVTGYDIISFWVARMIFSSLEFMGREPFHTVVIHGMVRDTQGRKMSKSLNNGIDPADIVAGYGADALRFMLIHGSAPGNDMSFQQERLEQARNFANKIWNASRFVLMNLEGYQPGPPLDSSAQLTLPDRWILSRLNKVTTSVQEALERYDFGEALGTLYDFLWDEFCDWYIELVKPRLQPKAVDPDPQTSEEAAADLRLAQGVLATVLRTTLELLHPFMPFISEEIWQHLPKGEASRSIMITDWPKTNATLIDNAAERNMTALMEGIRSIRNLRGEMNVPHGRKIILQILPASPEGRTLAEEAKPLLQRLANASEVTMISEAEVPAKALTIALSNLTIYLPLAEMIDIPQEIARLAKELAALEEEIARLESRLQNEGFLSKAPQAVVEQERVKLADYLSKKQTLVARQQQLS